MVSCGETSNILEIWQRETTTCTVGHQDLSNPILITETYRYLPISSHDPTCMPVVPRQDWNYESIRYVQASKTLWQPTLRCENDNGLDRDAVGVIWIFPFCASTSSSFPWRVLGIDEILSFTLVSMSLVEDSILMVDYRTTCSNCDFCCYGMLVSLLVNHLYSVLSYWLRTS